MLDDSGPACGDGPFASELARLGEPHGFLRTDPFLVLCATVRDEGDILDAFLAFHLSQGVDLILIVDHASQDGTRGILDWYAENESVVYFDQPGPRRYQGKWMTHMARLAAQLGASWVVNADGDEFWMPRYGTLRDVFRALPENEVSLPAFFQDFYPPQAADGFDYEKQTLWDPGETGTYYIDVTKPKMAHRAHPQIVVHGGNHTVTLLEGKGPLPSFGGILVDILHFPVRSFEQFERKVAVRFLSGDGLDHQRAGGTYPGQHHRGFNERRLSGGLRSRFDEWMAVSTTGARVATDDRLAVYLRGLRAAQSSERRSPAGFVQPPREDGELSPVMAREISLARTVARLRTRQLRGLVKEQHRTIKGLRRDRSVLIKENAALRRALRERSMVGRLRTLRGVFVSKGAGRDDEPRTAE